MNNPIVRYLIRASLVALASGVIVIIVGLVLHWKTAVQFSDGLFWGGAILVSIGLINALGMMNQPGDSRMKHSQSGVYVDPSERHKLVEAEMLRGTQLMILVGISAVLMFGFSALALQIGKLF
jgi:hypothetical protein